MSLLLGLRPEVCLACTSHEDGRTTTASRNLKTYEGLGSEVLLGHVHLILVDKKKSNGRAKHKEEEVFSAFIGGNLKGCNREHGYREVGRTGQIMSSLKQLGLVGPWSVFVGGLETERAGECVGISPRLQVGTQHLKYYLSVKKEQTNTCTYNSKGKSPRHYAK